jgi:hypothetical protein
MGTESAIFPVTMLITHMRRYDSDRRPSVEHGCDLLLDGPFEVSKILVYTLSFVFAFSCQQYTSNLGVLQINVYHRESKAI